jgi:hypothetical protein
MALGDVHLVRCNTTRRAFIDKDFACHQGLQEQGLRETRELQVIDGMPIESGMMTTIAILDPRIWGHH